MKTIATKAILVAAIGSMAISSGFAAAKTRAGDNRAFYSATPDRGSQGETRGKAKSTGGAGTQLALGALAVAALAGGMTALSGGDRPSRALPAPAPPPVSPGT